MNIETQIKELELQKSALLLKLEAEKIEGDQKDQLLEMYSELKTNVRLCDDAICELDLVYLENGYRTAINPAILELYIKGELIDPLHIRDFEKLKAVDSNLFKSSNNEIDYDLFQKCKIAQKNLLDKDAANKKLKAEQKEQAQKKIEALGISAEELKLLLGR